MDKKRLLKRGTIVSTIWALVCLVAINITVDKFNSISMLFLLGVIVLIISIVVYWKMELPLERWKLIMIFTLIPSIVIIQAYLVLMHNPIIWLTVFMISGTLIIFCVNVFFLMNASRASK
jgi:hypothetical protein